VNRRRYLALLFAGFALTRVYLIWAAHLPVNESHSGDVEIYSAWASEMLDRDLAPYSGVPIEYPPGLLPGIVAPALVSDDDQGYRDGFILLMAAVDVSAFLGLVRMSRRTGVWLGPWLWIAGTALLGPVSYLRLDLVPAAATIWAVERLSAGSGAGGGGWLGFGAVAKVYPVFLAPMAFLVSRDRRRFLKAGAAVTVLFLLPHLGALPDLWESVFAFHADRGIQAESTWGLAFLVSSRLEGTIVLQPEFGSIHVGSAVESITKAASTVLALGAVGAGAYLAGRRIRRGDAASLAQVMFGVLALLLGVGTVFSPQFVVWLAAMAAAALCLEVPRRWPMLLVLLAAALTQFVFPFRIEDLHLAQPMAIAPMLLRNLTVFVAGVGALLTLETYHNPGRSSRIRR